MSDKVILVLQYLQNVVGIERGHAPLDFQNIGDIPPFWSGNGDPPPLEDIKSHGIVCVGLTNLARRKVGLEIPGNITGEKKADFPGGTLEWFKYLNSRNWLEYIDFNKQYPDGTLLIWDFNPRDQGHVAIIYKSNIDLLSSEIIHSFNNSKKDKGVVIEKLTNYKKCKNFTHICLPIYWLEGNK